jgi:MFS family permease
MTQAEHPTSLAALRARYGERYRWLLLLSVMVGTMASIMSSTIVNVAIPGMSQHFALGQERAQWVTSGFMVAMTVSMLTTPWLLARYGYRAHLCRLHVAAAGRRRGGRAWPDDFGLVLAARVAEGLAAGVVQPIPAIIILRAFEPNEQGRASGIFGMGVVLAPALGPSIGGLLVDWFGWRSIFFMVVPFCLASLWLAYKFVPVNAPGGVAANRDGAALDWRRTGAGQCRHAVPAQRPGGTAQRHGRGGRRPSGRCAGGAVRLHHLAAPLAAAALAQRA